MAWREVHPRYLHQQPGTSTRWFCDDRPVGGGGLQLWTDNNGGLVGFKLDLEEWPSQRHYFAAWRRGEPVQTDTTLDGRRDPRAAERLRRYLWSNASALEPSYLTTIAALLGSVSQPATTQIAA